MESTKGGPDMWFGPLPSFGMGGVRGGVGCLGATIALVIIFAAIFAFFAFLYDVLRESALG